MRRTGGLQKARVRLFMGVSFRLKKWRQIRLGVGSCWAQRSAHTGAPYEAVRFASARVTAEPRRLRGGHRLLWKRRRDDVVRRLQEQRRDVARDRDRWTFLDGSLIRRVLRDGRRTRCRTRRMLATSESP